MKERRKSVEQRQRERNIQSSGEKDELKSMRESQNNEDLAYIGAMKRKNKVKNNLYNREQTEWE
jgi:hypothetical protein